MTKEVIGPQAQQLAARAESIIKEYENYTIKDMPTFQLATDDLRMLKSRIKEISDLRKSMTVPLDESKKKIIDFFKRPTELLTQAENIIKKAMIEFKTEWDRNRKKEEDRLKDEQDRKAQKLEEKATRAEEGGNVGKAERLREQADQLKTTTPIIPDEKIKGISMKKIWKFKVTDESLIPREFLKINEKMLNQYAQSVKGTIKIPGVEFYCEESVSARSL